MKKLLTLIMFVTMIPLVSNAQIGSALKNKASQAVSKAVNKAVDRAVDRAAERVVGAAEARTRSMFGLPSANDTIGITKETDPNDIIKKVPALPNQQKLIDYSCMQLRSNVSDFKQLTHAVQRFRTRVSILMLEVTSSTTEGMDDEELSEEQLAHMGLTPEDIQKSQTMSQEEAQSYLAEKVLAHTQENTNKLVNDNSGLYEQYLAINDAIEALYDKVEKDAEEIWLTKYALKAKGRVTEAILSSYLKEVLPDYIAVVKQALELRRSQQLPLAQQLDKKGVDTGYFYTFAQLCVMEYMNEALKISEYDIPLTID